MNHPGCFSSASVYHSGSKVCATCNSNKECGEASRATLERIKASVDVVAIIERHDQMAKDRKADQERRRREYLDKTTEVCNVMLSEEDQKILATINSKAQQTFRLLCAGGYIGSQAQEKLQSGINPLANQPKPAFIRVVIDQLLQGKKTRAQLKEALMETLNWAQSSAISHVSMAVGALHAFGHVTVKGNEIELVGKA